MSHTQYIDAYQCAGGTVTRLQLALNVADLDEAIGFYTELFGAPAKVRPGYANFAVADPPLKLVLIEDSDGAGRGCARCPQSPRCRG